MLMDRRNFFATRLRKEREKAGISQYRLGQLAGISKQSLSRLEMGLSQPNWETVQRIAAALGTDCRVFADPSLAKLAEPTPVGQRGRPRKGK
jgi:transcriptional regulator with XRE-family HTH domain